MKRQTSEQRIRSIAIANARFRKKVRRASIRSNNLERYEKERKPIKLVAPGIFSFSNNYEETVQFLDDFRTTALKKAGPLQTLSVDLTSIRHISVIGAMVLAAEFHRWSILRRTRLRPSNVARWSPRLLALFDDLGVFDLLDIQNRYNINSTTENITLTPLKSGRRQEGSEVQKLIQSFKNDIASFSDRLSLYDGLMEAVENVIHHGYPSGYEPKYPFAGQRWWGAGCLDLDQACLRFFIYDQGAGIPYTLPRSGFFEAVQHHIERWFPGSTTLDGTMLRAALEVGRTQTNLPHRGKGLGQIQAAIRDVPGSRLRILSGKGAVTVDSDGQIQDRTHSRHIGGTLIEWSLPVSAFGQLKAGGQDDA